MFDAGSVLWRWLADQPAYIEVAIGMAFILVLAPAILAAVAVSSTKLETIAASIALRLLPSGAGSLADPEPINRDAKTPSNASQG
jgi:hypothetical protein